jgi:hypothetical protein
MKESGSADEVGVVGEDDSDRVRFLGRKGVEEVIVKVGAMNTRETDEFEGDGIGVVGSRVEGERAVINHVDLQRRELGAQEIAVVVS